MILYIFNNHFPDNSGFGKRCKKEIELLSKKNSVVVLCRKRNLQKSREIYKTKYGKITLVRFSAKSSITERTNKTYLSGLYEIKRNIDLLWSLSLCLLKVLWKNRQKNNIKIYAVVSPLTVPFISWLFAIFFGRSAEIIEFHDLEPELAMHTKGLTRKSIVVKIEFFLEKMLCKLYKRVLVTNQTQAKKITQRTGVFDKKVFIVPNSIQVEEFYCSTIDIRKKYKICPSDFLVGYISNFSYDYTISGMIELLYCLDKRKKQLKHVKIILVGDGDGLNILKRLTQKLALDNIVLYTGRISNVPEIVSALDAGLIPWTRSEVSGTILPTKLFEYMSSKKPIIAPDYGEFKKNIINFTNGILFDRCKDIIDCIFYLKNNRKSTEIIKENGYILYQKFCDVYSENYLIKEVYD
jgi:glycosyltransferase involved in cell wall biosynthesis